MFLPFYGLSSSLSNIVVLIFSIFNLNLLSICSFYSFNLSEISLRVLCSHHSVGFLLRQTFFPYNSWFSQINIFKPDYIREKGRFAVGMVGWGGRKRKWRREREEEVEIFTMWSDLLPLFISLIHTLTCRESYSFN